MIDEYYTFLIFGYHSDNLSRCSNKPIVAICDDCGLYRRLSKSDYNDLCKKCAHNTPKYLSERSKMSLDQWADSEYRDMVILKRLPYYTMPERLKANSEGQKKYHIDNPEAGKEHSKRLEIYWSDQNNRDEQMERLKKYNEDPEVRKTRSEGLIQYNINHPDAAERQSARVQGIAYEEWTGFSGSDWRDWNKAIYLNATFDGCHRHHITETIVACIPAELHYHIPHNLKTGYNMGEMNMLALQFIHGCYDD